MKCKKLKLAAVGVASVLAVSVGTAQAEVYVDTCQSLAGFNKGSLGMGVAAIVQGNSAGFLSNRKLKGPDYCQVMYPESSGKGKPDKNSVKILPEDGKEMTQDECSMYRYLGSIDSKLAMAKVSDAYVVTGDMISKVNTLFSSGQLSEQAYKDIYNALAVDEGWKMSLQSCVYKLMSQ